MPRARKRRCVTIQVEAWLNPDRARGWTYWVPGWVKDLAVDDWVIIDNPQKAGTPIFGLVVDVKPPRDACARATKWLVDKVDWVPYRALAALAPPSEGK